MDDVVLRMRRAIHPVRGECKSNQQVWQRTRGLRPCLH